MSGKCRDRCRATEFFSSSQNWTKKWQERRQKKGVTNNNEIETSGKKNKIRRNYLLRRAFFICLLCRTRNYRQINKLFKSTIYVILANHPYKIYCNTLLSSQQSLSPKTNPLEWLSRRWIEQSWTTVCTGRRQPCRLPCIETLEKYARQCWSVSFRTVSYTHLTLPTTPYV